ncbi:MAG: TIM barrel protein [Anaerocolumna sp.]
MNLDICIDMVYNDEDFLKSMEKVRSAGMKSYEFWGWWNKDMDSILEKQKELNMNCIIFCTKPVTLLDSLKREEFIAGLRESIAMAKRFGVKLLTAQTGNRITDKTYEEQWDSLAAGLKECAPVLKENDITLLIEPLNLTDHPGYFLTRSKEAFRLVKEVGSENIKILYDVYHFQIAEGDLIKTISDNIAEIGHFHSAGNPGRGNITEGEINYMEVLRAIYHLGYTGHIGFEGKISGNKEEGLKKAKTLFDNSIEA